MLIQGCFWSLTGGTKQLLSYGTTCLTCPLPLRYAFCFSNDFFRDWNILNASVLFNYIWWPAAHAAWLHIWAFLILSNAEQVRLFYWSLFSLNSCLFWLKMTPWEQWYWTNTRKFWAGLQNDDFKLTLKLWKSEVSLYQYEWPFVRSQIISYIAIVFKLDFLLRTSH